MSTIQPKYGLIHGMLTGRFNICFLFLDDGLLQRLPTR